jgi:hypothetical protein
MAFRLCFALALGLAAALLGCSPHVGSSCQTNSQCSLQGTLVCDNSQPAGYCTSFNCAPDSCQNGAACVLLSPAVPGCPYDDYKSPVRTGRSMCLQHCHKDSDCRTNEGYVCADPRQPPWDAVVLDDDQEEKVCIVTPNFSGGAAMFDDAAVCQPSLGDAAPPPIEAGVTFSFDAGSVEVDASDASAPDASDAAALDAGVDAAGD